MLQCGIVCKKVWVFQCVSSISVVFRKVGNSMLRFLFVIQNCGRKFRNIGCLFCFIVIVQQDVQVQIRLWWWCRQFLGNLVVLLEKLMIVGELSVGLVCGCIVILCSSVNRLCWFVGCVVVVCSKFGSGRVGLLGSVVVSLMCSILWMVCLVRCGLVIGYSVLSMIRVVGLVLLSRCCNLLFCVSGLSGMNMVLCLSIL